MMLMTNVNDTHAHLVPVNRNTLVTSNLLYKPTSDVNKVANDTLSPQTYSFQFVNILNFYNNSDTFYFQIKKIDTKSKMNISIQGSLK